MRQASLREIAELVRAAGTTLPEAWLAEQWHELKHHGPAAVLKEVTRLLHMHPHVPDLDKKVTSLCKREQHMGVTPLSSVGLAHWQWQCGKCQQGRRPSTTQRGWHALAALACQSHARFAHSRMSRSMGTSVATGMQPAPAPGARAPPLASADSQGCRYVQAAPAHPAPSAAGCSCSVQDFPSSPQSASFPAFCLLHYFHSSPPTSF